MVIDYSQRRAVSKNRPKKQPVGFLIPILAVAVIVSFAGGVVTGWFLFRGNPALSVDSGAVQPQPPVREAAKPPATGVPAPQPLTFYETLSKGNSNALIGSGFNPRMTADTVVHKPPPSSPPALGAPQDVAAKPAAPQAAQGQDTASTPVHPPASPSVKETVRGTDPGKTSEGKKPSKEETFTVQVGSYKDRREAEDMLARTKGAGLPAYIVEARTADKGTWYRVRIGRKLDQQAANQLASKAGKGAITVPE